jgi:hypothetical protein
MNLGRRQQFDEKMTLDNEVETAFESTPTPVSQDEVEPQEVEVVESTVESMSEDDDQDTDEDISDELEKKSDNDVINDYLKPNSHCILCITPIWSLKLNKAYLDGNSYSSLIEQFSVKFEERTSRKLNKSLLHRHFRLHFDARAAAIAEYNKRRITTNDQPSTSTAQRDIFKLATKKYLDELEIFDTTAREMINKYQELETIIEEKRTAGKSFGIDELILKQAQILNALNKQAISKFKALSKVDLESKQGQFLSQLSFIGNKAIAGISQTDDKKGMLLTAKQTEEIYLNVVIRQMLARLEEPLKVLVPGISVDQKALFYRELKKSIEGMQEGINVDFDKQIKTSSQKLLTDKQDSQH